MMGEISPFVNFVSEISINVMDFYLFLNSTSMDIYTLLSLRQKLSGVKFHSMPFLFEYCRLLIELPRCYL